MGVQAPELSRAKWASLIAALVFGALAICASLSLARTTLQPALESALAIQWREVPFIDVGSGEEAGHARVFSFRDPEGLRHALVVALVLSTFDEIGSTKINARSFPLVSAILTALLIALALALRLRRRRAR